MKLKHNEKKKRKEKKKSFHRIPNLDLNVCDKPLKRNPR
jgi:hypothetical protein